MTDWGAWIELKATHTNVKKIIIIYLPFHSPLQSGTSQFDDNLGKKYMTGMRTEH